jgi:hypothetical protein
MATPLSKILERMAAAGKAYESDEIGSRENLIELGRDLVATLEIPSEFLQRSFWAEVSTRSSVVVYCLLTEVAGTISALQVRRGSQALPAPKRCRRNWSQP